MRKLKRKFKIKKLNKKRKLKNRMIPVLISLLIISITYTTTQAYFNRGLDLSSLLGGNSDGGISIKNGVVNLQFSDVPTEWNVSDSQISKTTSSGTTIINNPKIGTTVTYGPVVLESTGTNLTTNVDLAINYSLEKIGGKPEDDTGTIIIPEDKVEPFEVIVGDIDNLNYGFNGETYDVYSGNLFDRNSKFTTVNGVPDRGLRVLPQAYDAAGTDRRMVVSGFYDYFKPLTNNYLGVRSVDDDNKWGSVGTVQYLNGKNNWIDSYSYKDSQFAKITRSGTDYYYDGYTDRTIRGRWGSDDVGGIEKDAIYDGLNWKYTQKVQPLTFKYGEISNDKGIDSVCFQIFVDDLQASNPSSETKYFPNKSTTSYKAYLKVKGESEDTKIEVSNWGTILNNVHQIVPSGTMVTLTLPMDEKYNQYIDTIKRASGLDKGLELIIDDPDNISGDSFCIDFAKMTVNAEASVNGSSLITISGTVYDKDGKTPLSGVKVTSGDGRTTTTDSNGNYSLNVAKGFVNLRYSLSGKVDKYHLFKQSITANQSGINVTMDEDEELLGDTIKASNKMDIELVIDEYRDYNVTEEDLSSIMLDFPSKAKVNQEIVTVEDGQTIIRTTAKYEEIKSILTQVQQAQCSLGIRPGYKYKIYYNLNLKSAEQIGDNTPFKLKFTSSLSAKSTQENNPAWNTDGSGEKYASSYSEKEIEGGGTETDTPSVDEITDGIFKSSNPEIYFETPVHSSDTSIDQCGSEWWPDEVPEIKIGTSSSNLIAINNVEKVSSANTSWYRAKPDNIEKNSIINVVSNGQDDLINPSSVATGYRRIIVKTDYSDPYIHAWISGTSDIDKVTNKQMNSYGKGIYYYDIPSTVTNIQLKNGSGWNDGKVDITGVNNESTIVSYSLYSGKATKIDISQYLVNSSGDLYYFSTNKIFICTN